MRDVSAWRHKSTASGLSEAEDDIYTGRSLVFVFLSRARVQVSDCCDLPRVRAVRYSSNKFFFPSRFSQDHPVILVLFCAVTIRRKY